MNEEKYIEEIDEANELRSELNDSINSLNKNLISVLNSDKDINSSLKDSLEKLLTLLSKKFDITPIVNKVSEQNSNILSLINGLSQSPVVIDNSKFEDVLNRIILLVDKNNEYLQSGLKQTDYSQQLESIELALNKKPEWEFKIERDNSTFGDGRILKVIASVKK